MFSKLASFFPKKKRSMIVITTIISYTTIRWYLSEEFAAQAAGRAHRFVKVGSEYVPWLNETRSTARD